MQPVEDRKFPYLRAGVSMWTHRSKVPTLLCTVISHMQEWGKISVSIRKLQGARACGRLSLPARRSFRRQQTTRQSPSTCSFDGAPLNCILSSVPATWPRKPFAQLAINLQPPSLACQWVLNPPKIIFCSTNK